MDTASKHRLPLAAVLILLVLAATGGVRSAMAEDLPGLRAWQAKYSQSVSGENIGASFVLPVSASQPGMEGLEPVVPRDFDEGETQDPGPGEPLLEERGSRDQELIERPSVEMARGEPYPYDSYPTLISSGSWLWDGCWYTQQEAAMLVKMAPRVEPLAFDGTRGFSTADSNQGYEAGTRLTLGRFLGRDRANRDHSVEFTFLGLFNWDARASFNANDSVPLFGVGFNGVPGLGVLDQFVGNTNVFSENALTSRYLYQSEFDSFELNFRVRSRPVHDQMVMQPDGTWERHETTSLLTSFLGGIRYMRLDENFLYSAVGTAFGANLGVPASAPIATSGDYTTRTHNDMIGIQLGIESIEQHASWQWGLRGKLGGFINFADRQKSLISTFGTTTETVDDEALTFLAEGSVFASYQLRPNLALRASYDVLFIQGLALAPENIGVTTMPLTSPIEFSPINVNGGAFFHGLFLGFDYVW